MKKIAIILLLVAVLHGLHLITGLEIPLVKWLGVSAGAVGSLLFTLFSTMNNAFVSLFGLTPNPERVQSWQHFWAVTFAK